MPLLLKTVTDFYNSIVGKFSKELPEVDPTIEASLAKMAAVTSAVAASNLQEGLEDAVDQMFWQTQDGDFLAKTGEYNKITQNEPQSAIGFCSVEGVLNTIIPTGTNLTGNNGLTYSVLQDAVVQEYEGEIDLSYSGGIVTAITAAEHTLSTGITVTISNAVQTDYNGTFVITVIDNVTFQYELTAGSLTTDSGDYLATYASLNIECLASGQNTNIGAGGTLQIDVVDIDDTAYAQTGGISGGTDLESTKDFKVRVGEAQNLTPGIAAISGEIFSAKKIAGNTRVFVERGQTSPVGTPGVPGYIPALGQTVIYVLRDNDVSITPSQTILDETKQQIIDDGNWPTLTSDENLYLFAPILVQQNFELQDLTPNTVSMQNAVRNRLIDFFRDNARVGNPTYTILLEDIKTFLRTITDATGARLTAVTVNNPSSNLVAASGEIYIRGTVTFV